MFCKESNQFQAKALCFCQVVSCGEPDPVVADCQIVRSITLRKSDGNGRGSMPGCLCIEGLGKRVLEGVGDELVDDQPARRRPGKVEIDTVRDDDSANVFFRKVGPGDLFGEGGQIYPHIHPREHIGPVQGLVDKRHAPCPVLEILLQLPA